MKKTLITGATGALGNLVANNLSKKVKPEEIAVLVRDTQKDIARNYVEWGFDVRKGDYDDVESLEKALEGIEALYLVSGNDIGARLEQHKNIIQTAVKKGVKHLLYTSTVRKDESATSPLFPVVNSHKLTEEAIFASGLTYTIMRHNLYAEVVPMFIGDKSTVLEAGSIYLPTGTGKTNFAPRKDLAEAAAIILADLEKHKDKIYEFNGSEQVNFQTISELIGTSIKTELPYISPDVSTFENTMKSAGLPEEIIGMLTMFSLGISSGEFDQGAKDLEVILDRKTQPLREFFQEIYG